MICFLWVPQTNSKGCISLHNWFFEEIKHIWRRKQTRKQTCFVLALVIQLKEYLESGTHSGIWKIVSKLQTSSIVLLNRVQNWQVCRTESGISCCYAALMWRLTRFNKFRESTEKLVVQGCKLKWRIMDHSLKDLQVVLVHFFCFWFMQFPSCYQVNKNSTLVILSQTV